MSFEITSPAVIHCGAGRFEKIKVEATRLGRVAMVVTGGRLRASDMIADLVENLDRHGVDASVAGPVTDEPTVGDVDLLAARAREIAADVVIAVGGGSVIDAAKAAAAVATNEGTTEDYQLKRRELVNPPLAQVVAPTTAGTGSEATRVSVLTNIALGVKRSISHPLMTPDAVVLDPELLVTLPLYLTTLTAMDALAHAIESAVSRNANSYTKSIALAGIRELADGLPRSQEDPVDLDARLKCLLGSCFAGLAMQAGLGASHSLAPAICIVGKMRHSEAVAALLPHVIRLNERLQPGVYDEVKSAMKCGDLAGRIEQLAADGSVSNDLSVFGINASEWEEIHTVMSRYASHRQTNPAEVTDTYAGELFSMAVCE